MSLERHIISGTLKRLRYDSDAFVYDIFDSFGTWLGRISADEIIAIQPNSVGSLLRYVEASACRDEELLFESSDAFEHHAKRVSLQSLSLERKH